MGPFSVGDNVAGHPALALADDDALQRLVDEHEPLFRRIAWRLGSRPQDYEDAMQGARLGFLEALKGYDPMRGVTIGGYARGFIVKRVLEATFRSARRRPKIQVDVGFENVPIEIEAVEEPGFERVEREVDSRVVQRFLHGLPDHQREIAVRIGVEGATAAQVAREQGVSVTAICKTWGKIVRAGRQAVGEAVA